MKTSQSPAWNVTGMTFLEMVVVITVFVAVIGVTLVGASAWKRGADRSGCIANIRDAQQAVRAYQNLRELTEGMVLNVPAEIIGPGKLLKVALKCPGGGEYSYIDHIPYHGEVVMACDLSLLERHVPNRITDW